MQLLPSLLSELQAVCATFPDPRKGRGGNISPTDFGLSAFAMFFMQSASFLAYQRTMEKPRLLQLPDVVRHRPNPLRQLHPRLSGRGGPRAAAALFRTCGGVVERAADAASLRPAGRKDPDRLDGTEFFCSQKLGCPVALPDAQARQRQDRELSFYAVGDGRGRPATPGCSFDARVRRAPGRLKCRDCERNAVRRCRQAWRAAGAKLRPVFLGDDLFACHPVAKMDHGMPATISSSPADFHKTLYDFIDGAEFRRHEEKVRRRNTKETLRYRWIEAVRCATARTRYWSTGLASRLSTPRARSNIPWPATPAFPSPRTMSPRSSPAAERDGRSRTRASTC